MHGLLGVAHCPLRRAGHASPAAAAPPLDVLYVAADPLAAELHRLHGCADLACVFWPGEGGGRLEPLAWPGRLESAGLTPREADVLALLLARRTNDEIAAELVLSPSTVRAHCRAVLRKMNARDRRHLWALLPRSRAGDAPASCGRWRGRCARPHAWRALARRGRPCTLGWRSRGGRRWCAFARRQAAPVCAGPALPCAAVKIAQESKVAGPIAGWR